MRRPRFFSQILAALLFVTFLAMFAVAWHATTLLSILNRERLAENLEMRARFAARDLEPIVLNGQLAQVDEACKRLGAELSTRFTVILKSGEVLGDSAEDPAVMENHRERPEIHSAIRGEIGVAPRYSNTLGIRMLYVAVPIVDNGTIIGVTRAAIPETSILRQLWSFYLRLSVGGLAIAVLAASLSLLISQRFSRPLQEMQQIADRFASGDLDHRLIPSASEEIAGLAQAMNEMAEQLDERLRTVLRQGNEQRAILTSMVEGVLAVDPDGKIISMNRAAARMIHVEASSGKGQRLDKIVQFPTLQSFVRSILDGQDFIQEEIEIGKDGTRILQANGSALQDESGKRIGGVIVLNDITRLRRLENVRREFVANVSHELKTPITSIKGYVETLREGVLQSPEDAEKFLSIVERQADRLNAIIDDLLSLSRIERGEEAGEIEFEKTALNPIIHTAIDLCRSQAREKEITVTWHCPEDIEVRVSPPLVEQAIANLIDNAIKYSASGSTLTVETEQAEEEVSIHVIDHGCGIAAEHLPRLFERFYRVDKARSRKQGGTGLGLAIVKHVAHVHNGRVSVESEPGIGSRFTIHLPTAPIDEDTSATVKNKTTTQTIA